jgi:hypothetical protein
MKKKSNIALIGVLALLIIAAVVFSWSPRSLWDIVGVSAAAPEPQNRFGPIQLSKEIDSLKASGVDFERVEIFRSGISSATDRVELRSLITEGSLLQLNEQVASALLAQSRRELTMPIPFGAFRH